LEYFQQENLDLKAKKKNLIDRSSELEGMNQELEKLLAEKEKEIESLNLRILAAKNKNDGWP